MKGEMNLKSGNKLQRMYFRKRFNKNWYLHSADVVNGKATLKSLKIGNLISIENQSKTKNAMY